MSFKTILEEANRYVGVVTILNDIINDDKMSSSYPVNAFVDEDGITQWRVDGKLVKKEAKVLLDNINNNSNITTRFDNLWEYISSHSNMLLHNYAISISHRKDPNIDMDDIRNWLVLGSLICDLQFEYEDQSDFTIPEGWKNL